MKIFDRIEVFNVGYNEIEKLVNDNLFPDLRNYDLLDNENSCSDARKLFKGISKKLEYEWDEEYINKFLNGDHENSLRYALIELCRRDLIPEGDYLIDLTW